MCAVRYPSSDIARALDQQYRDILMTAGRRRGRPQARSDDVRRLSSWVNRRFMNQNCSTAGKHEGLKSPQSHGEPAACIATGRATTQPRTTGEAHTTTHPARRPARSPVPRATALVGVSAGCAPARSSRCNRRAYHCAAKMAPDLLCHTRRRR